MSLATNKSYETVYILKPSLSDDDAKTIHDKVDNVIAKFKGTVKAREDWGLKELAYLIDDQSNGRYVVVQYNGEGGVVEEIERHFKIISDVMRFLTVKVPADYDFEKVKNQMKLAEEAAKQAKELRAEKRSRF
jgi:small subunit ribosomal protein S6